MSHLLIELYRKGFIDEETARQIAEDNIDSRGTLQSFFKKMNRSP